MNKKNLALIEIISVVGIFASGCGTATPTRAPVPLATQAPLVITVVVTTTPLPVTATPDSALGTATVATTQAAITPTRLAALPTSTTARVATATRRPATPTTASASPSPTATVFIAKYPAPNLIGPNFIDEAGKRKDERHYPSDALAFEWESPGGLGNGECYLINVLFTPGNGDYFLQCNASETLKSQSQTVRFTLVQPGRAGPNYTGLLPNPAGDVTVSWWVAIVRDDGVAADGVHRKYTLLSPQSATFHFPLKGG